MTIAKLREMGVINAEAVAHKALLINQMQHITSIERLKTATDEQANEVCAVIRALIAELYTKDAADKFVIQYGGSMNDANAAELLAQYDVDGGLIGGASLIAEDFSVIVKAASI